MVDFGFNREINKQACQSQTAYIKELMAVIENTKESNDKIKADLIAQLAETDDEIAKIQADLNSVQTRRRSIVNEMEALDKNLEALERHYAKEVNKIQYHINFRIPNPKINPQDLN